MAQVTLGKGDVKLIRAALLWKFRCPQCRTWDYLTDDEFWGRDTIECTTPGCDLVMPAQDLSKLFEEERPC